MIQVLLIIQIIVTVLMIATILFQRNSSDGLGGLGGGQMASVSTDGSGPIAKLTGWLGAIFMINCLVMAAITARSSSTEDKILEDLGAGARIPVQERQEIPVSPDVPETIKTPVVDKTDENISDNIDTLQETLSDTIDSAVDAVKEQGQNIKETLNPATADTQGETIQTSPAQ